MKSKSLLFITSALLVAAVFIPPSGYCLYTGKPEQPKSEFAPGRLIVKFKPEADRKMVPVRAGANITTGIANIDKLNAKFLVKEQKRIFSEFKESAFKDDRFSSVHMLEVPEGTNIKQMKAEYEKLSEVEYTEPDYIVILFDAPNDPLFAHQWYLNNTGQGYYGIDQNSLVIKFGTSDADIDALEAWQRNDQTVVPLVGIIDTGVDLDHEDLQANIWVNPGEDLNHNGIIDPVEKNNFDDDHNGFKDDFYGWDFAGNSFGSPEDNDPTDYMGHGTHCAGIVASVKDNGLGVSGINTPCRIAAIKNGPALSFSVCAKSIIYATDIGCDVINMSWGSTCPSQLLKDALTYAIQRGVLPVAAAGNSAQEGNPTIYPAAFENALAIGASNSADQVVDWSSYGEYLDVVAPGKDVLSLRADSTDFYGNGVHVVNEHYYLSSGTSMATPCAVGVAAYILAASPGISNDSVIAIIQRSADDIVYPYGGDSLYSPGKDIYSGYGRVNLGSALAFISGQLAKISYPYENQILSGDVAVIGTAAGADFNNYILEYGEGLAPTSWITITSSNLPVTSDILGIWHSSGLAGLYAIRLTVGEQNQAVVHVIANNGISVNIDSPTQNDTALGYARIYGSTIVPDFSGYTLEYGYGELPSDWYQITSSTKMVVGGLLGEWQASSLEEGYYTLRLSVADNSGETYSDSVVIYVKSLISESWVQELSNFGSLSPAIGDIDGDGDDEIVVGVGAPGYQASGGVEVFSHEGQREVGWPKDTFLNMMSSPALGDLDGDGIKDIVICSWQGGVRAYLSSAPNWFGSAVTTGGQWSLATPIIADLEKDGSPEVLTINQEGGVYAWRNNGESVIPGSGGLFAQVSINHPNDLPCLAVADLDRDGANEVITGAACTFSGGGIYIWDINGNLILGPQNYPDTLTQVCGIAIANIDTAQDLEVIVFGSNYDYFTLSAFKKDGTQPSNYPIVLEDLSPLEWYGNHPAIGDLEGNGTLEIVVTAWSPIGEARVYAWHQDGTPLGSLGPKGLLASMKSPNAERKKKLLSKFGNNIGEILPEIRSMNEEELSVLVSTLDQDPAFVSVPETFGSPVLADVNQDGKADIIARAGYAFSSGRERVFAWDYQGVVIPGFPLYTPAGEAYYTYIPYTPVIADIDKDGNLNMVLTMDEYPSFRLVSWDLCAVYDPSYIPWPKYMHDRWNSGRYGFQLFSDWVFDIGDVVCLINYLYRNGPAPEPLESGDVNCDGVVDIGDVVFLINYLFKGGPRPLC